MLRVCIPEMVKPLKYQALKRPFASPKSERAGKAHSSMAANEEKAHLLKT